MRAEQVTDPHCFHAEGPVWHPEWPGLRWVDMLAGSVLTLDRTTGLVTRNQVGDVVAALRPCVRGGAVLALERGFALANDALDEIRPMPPLWPDPGVRMNEGACDPDGRFYCGSMAYDETPGAGTLYRFDGTGVVEPVLSGVTISNGLAFSPDGGTAYYVDTPTQRVDAFDYTGGELLNRRTLVEIDPASGSPDGLTVDAEGGLWVALFGGGAVHHYSSRGQLVDVIEVPVTNVTACTFGGQQLNELYITTSRQHMPPGRYGAAGAVFRVRLPVRGLPPLPFLPA